MPTITCTVKFIYHNATVWDKFLFEKMYQNEFMKAYNKYVDRANNGLTKIFNDDFDDLYPDYFENHKTDKNWTNLTEYNSYMAQSYNREIINPMNKANPLSPLEYFISPEEVAFSARFKWHPAATVEFVLVKIDV